MPLLWAAISAHGFGHAAQVVPVLNALGRLVPNLRVLLRTMVPASFFEHRLTVPWELSAVQQDVGCIQNGPLTTVTARITFDETIDSHSGPTALKGIVIGASMFLLSPFIELDYDYTAQAHLELERWDGHITHYDARSSGTAHYNLFGASPVVINELKGQVIETCLNALMNQLVHDTPLYMASKTPLPASTIHTITVKARRPAILQGALPAIPVSQNPAP
ncbi:MAG: hypothetical protein HP490_01870 [Nitrospira sp.]|nr:hypothetical protein [Nitrospira sp.]